MMANRPNMAHMNPYSWSKDNMNEEMFQRPFFEVDFRNKRYNDAYGDYRGGYSPRPPLDCGNWPGPNSHPRFPPPLMMCRGFRPVGPHGLPTKRFLYDDPAVKYLIRCGVPKDSLKHLPKELLELFRPEFCGLCVQSFDSFSSSRFHYVSKFHMKCQGKWLSQYGGDKPMFSKMAPLKPRDHYCELCDVEITSAQHAESHYSGKPHRAIVEKRRAPKNVMLRQKHMEDRLAMLVRREKKHLKAITENEPTEEKSPKIAPEKGPPELTCDICKTSVTSTEQMTLHLNGKRHLAKEKQHILRMMNGAEAQNEPDSKETASADMEDKAEEKTDIEEDCKEQKEFAEEDYDWGNGSGAWDEADKDAL